MWPSSCIVGIIRVEYCEERTLIHRSLRIGIKAREHLDVDQDRPKVKRPSLFSSTAEKEQMRLCNGPLKHQIVHE